MYCIIAPDSSSEHLMPSVSHYMCSIHSFIIDLIILYFFRRARLQLPCGDEGGAAVLLELDQLQPGRHAGAPALAPA